MRLIHSRRHSRRRTFPSLSNIAISPIHMNTDFYRLIGSIKTVIHFISTQYHDVENSKHDANAPGTERDSPQVKKQLTELQNVIDALLKEHAKISHAYFDFRRTMSRNAEKFYYAIQILRRKAPEWQIMDEELLQLIESYQATA